MTATHHLKMGVLAVHKNMNKKLPTINFKGKEYTLISERVKYFNETYSKGSIRTELVSSPESDRVIVKATIWPGDSERFFTGYSQAKWSDTSSFVNKSSALENAETSAVGRALALMGIGVTDSIASLDEVKKAQNVVSKITNGQSFTGDEYQQAIDVDYGSVAEATRQAHKEARAEYKTNKKAYQPKTLSHVDLLEE